MLRNPSHFGSYDAPGGMVGTDLASIGATGGMTGNCIALVCRSGATSGVTGRPVR